MRRVHEGQYIYIDIYTHTHNIYLCIGSKINFNARVSCFAQHYFDKNILGIGQCWWGVTLLTTILLNSTWLIGKMDKIFCYDGPIFTIILRVVKLLNRISFSNTHKAEVEPSCKIYFIACIYGYIVDVPVLMLGIFPQMLEKPWSSYPSHLLIVWDSTTYFECYSIAFVVWLSLAKENGCSWLCLPKNVLRCWELSRGNYNL